MATQSCPHLSPLTCSHFQNTLNLIFEYCHPSFQQCHQPGAILQKMPDPACIFHLCQGHITLAGLLALGMCSRCHSCINPWKRLVASGLLGILGDFTPA